MDIAVISEAELPAEIASNFAIPDYTTFLPLTKNGCKTRVVILVKSDLAIQSSVRLRLDLMSTEIQTVWIELKLRCSIVIGGIYRQWKSKSISESESNRLHTFLDQARVVASTSKSAVVLGDFNLDLHRTNDPTYNRKHLRKALLDGMETAGYSVATTPPTWRSYGSFDNAHRYSCLDHVYSIGTVLADVRVLDFAASDHWPVLVEIPNRPSHNLSRTLERRNYKAIKSAELEAALQLWPWEDVHQIVDVNEVHDFIINGITAALDKIAPIKSICVRNSNPLYLSSDTIDLMERRDRASGKAYRQLRNRVSSMVKRDRLRSSLAKLRESKNDPKILWSLANAALGKQAPPLPASLLADGIPTVGNSQAAKAMNSFYVSKIEKLRSNLPTVDSPPTSNWPPASSPFSFSFASAGKIARVIASLKATEALGLDGIPVSILKKGVETLASPIAHLVNRSLSSGIVPTAFKEAIVIPIFKGKGKTVSDPASYRPVAILPAMSKVLESVVKKDLEDHLAKVNALPETQYGFRPGKSASAALAMAHGSWLLGAHDKKVIGILAFDLSAAFDTVDKTQLLPKLRAMGINNSELSWFENYLTSGRQCVDWNGTRSDMINVAFGVRQGSLIGPLAYLCIVADLPACLHIWDKDNSSYADDFCTWVIADNLSSLKLALDERADTFAKFTAANGLVMNAAKTQLMVAGARPKDLAGFAVAVDGVDVKPSPELELLGVRFDDSLTTDPHRHAMAKAAQQRAALVSRLALHIPRGEYLRQLARGLLIGKIGYAVSAVVPPRLEESDPAHPPAIRSTQVAINDTARSILGVRRRDHIKISTLLHKAGLPSINELAIRATAMECWKSRKTGDLVDQLAFPTAQIPTRETRSNMAGIPNPLKGADTFVSHAERIWSITAPLRVAKSTHSAKAAAQKLANIAPL